jgi:4-alpha-glucanotransferase
MNDEAILERAQRAGIIVDWIDASQRPQRVSIASLKLILEALGNGPSPTTALMTATVGEPIVLSDADDAAPGELQLEDGRILPVTIADRLPPIATPGYHTLRFGGRELTLAVAPRRCLTLADVAPGERLWGLAVQIYSLKRAGDFGIGDTTGLAMLARSAAERGADALALSPTHSLFPDDLRRFAPYSPSSRQYLNPLLVDAAMVLGRQPDKQPGEDEAASALIDWPKASARKYAWLRRLYDDFRAVPSPLADSFEDFVREGGASLQGHVRFEARRGGDPGFYAFLQWLADSAFAATQKAARDAGMRIGLISDLAVGLDPGGAEVGSAPDAFLTGLSIGAPPDAFNPRGQDWGLTAYSPHALAARGFAPFISTLRASMRHAGGVRIDHAMGLMRLWLVPRGGSPRDGAYLSYPLDDLLRLLALESHRYRAVVIGEDLGTVPRQFRARCREAGIAGMDVLWFERDGGRFLRPDEWRDDAVAMTTTHDLPTVAGWWRGADLELRRGLGTASEAELTRRPAERAALWQAFTETGATAGPMPAVHDTDGVVDAAIGFVGRARGPLAIVALEDILGSVEQPNLPGTFDQHPNWRRRFDLPADQLLAQPAAERRLRRLNERRS